MVKAANLNDKTPLLTELKFEAQDFCREVNVHKNPYTTKGTQQTLFLDWQPNKKYHCHGQIQMAVNTLVECDATM